MSCLKKLQESSSSVQFDKLFCNQINACRVYDCKKITDLVRRYIACVDKELPQMDPQEQYGSDGICRKFLKSIVEYAKAACDNIYLGHFNVANIINRVIIENYVCIKAMQKNDTVWKYWHVHSWYITPRKYADDEGITERLDQAVERLSEEYKIDPSFLNSKVIGKDYGWIFPICKHYTFRSLYENVAPEVQDDYRTMCEFSHGVSYFQKEDPFTFDSSQLNTLSILFTYVHLAYQACYPGIHNYERMLIENRVFDYYDAIARETECE